MSATVGVGIIGLSANGGWAANAHLPALRALGSRYEVRGLCGSSPEAARAAGEKHNVAFHTDDPHVLANRPDIDLIVIAVKVPEHKSLTEAAISAGKAVYCEWPLGNGLDEAIFLERLAADSGVANFVRRPRQSLWRERDRHSRWRSDLGPGAEPGRSHLSFRRLSQHCRPCRDVVEIDA